MSLFNGYEKVSDNINTRGLPRTGGTMTGNINKGSNHIITSTNPTEPAHLARKKYIDDKVRVANVRGNFLPKSGGTMSGNINIWNNKILTAANPVSEKDLTRKKYVDDQNSKKLSLTGGTMSGNIVMGNNKTTTTADPMGDKDLTRKAYVDKFLKKTCGIMLGNIDLRNNKITTSSDPTNNNDLVRKPYVDGKVATSGGGIGNGSGTLAAKLYLLKSGGTMTGDIVMRNNQVTTTADPVDDNDMAKKKYVDDQNNLYMLIRGGSFNGNVNMNGNFISATYTPSNANHLTTKSYVDRQDGKKLNTSGGIMTGDINMNGNEIYNVKNIDSSSQGHHRTNKEYVDRKIQVESKNVAYQLNLIESYILNNDYQGYFEIYDDVIWLTYSSGKVEVWKNQAKNTWENFTQTNNNEKPSYKTSLVDPSKTCLYFDGINNNMRLNVTVDNEAGKSHVFSIFPVLSTQDVINERIFVSNGTNYDNKYYGFGWKAGKFLSGKEMIILKYRITFIL